MEIQRSFRDAWLIPQACCACGEPNVDGKPHTASVTLQREFKSTGPASEQLTTRTASFSFPRCAACERAQRAKSRGDNVAVALGLLLGLTGCVYVNNAGGGLLPWAIFVVAWLAVVYAVQKLMERNRARTWDADTLRRSRLSTYPVSVKRVGRQSVLPVLEFKFESDEYGEAFSAMNP